MRKLRVFTLKLLYGKSITAPLQLDAILLEIGSRDVKEYVFKKSRTFDEIDFLQNLEFLYNEGFVKTDGSIYSITPKGRLKLARGGFFAESKKEHLGIFAIWISFTAFLISAITFVFSLFR